MALEPGEDLDLPLLVRSDPQGQLALYGRWPKEIGLYVTSAHHSLVSLPEELQLLLHRLFYLKQRAQLVGVLQGLQDHLQRRAQLLVVVMLFEESLQVILLFGQADVCCKQVRSPFFRPSRTFSSSLGRSRALRSCASLCAS